MSIPKPLVQLNQLFISFSIVFSLLVSQWILLVPISVGIITLITKQNPIIRAGKIFLSKPAQAYPPEDKDQQLFNQWIATLCLSAAFLFFIIDQQVLTIIFSAMVLMAAVTALLGYCIGCQIRYKLKMWQYKQKTKWDK
ncbi:DUF4395 domain-containing protein [Salipaludibacillus sp. LMS25]|jgi:hypothetical protein|uniref:DUF4395 domain-containing protein n=1 Tax=Salipaludibacillus sp. LMS25 TaxID=2924031 RepID=UPI0020D17F0C|nr:DUF4395 domain-containing protein [Salipaludibacillus sp. LMS25]UTR14761.1 DUF4395 domain-containing protein [Salipaludibacillus sp. LMS25]